MLTNVQSLDTLFNDTPTLFSTALGEVDKCSVWRSRERTSEGEALRHWTRTHVDALRAMYHRPDLLTDPRRPTVGCLLLYMGYD
jgi:hypothetical protein